MMTKHGMRYGNFILRCDPLHMADGRFGAQVVVADEDGTQLVGQLFPALDPFATEAEAVAHAQEWGKKWVHDLATTR